MSKFLKNTTVTDIDLKNTGDRVEASTTFEIDPTKYIYYAKPEAITELTSYINSGDIIVADNVQDLTVANGVSLDRALDFLRYPDTAFNGRFLSDPERPNGFISKNIQEAIEEAKIGESVGGRTYVTEFHNNGNTANKWLFHIPTSEATDTLPYVTAWNIEIFGVTFGNKNEAVNCDVEFYVNGTATPDKVFTLEVRASRYKWHTTEATLFSMAQADGLSIFIKKVGNSTPSSVEVDLNVRITSTTVGEGEL